MRITPKIPVMFLMIFYLVFVRNNVGISAGDHADSFDYPVLKNNKKLDVSNFEEQRYSQKGLYYGSRILTKTNFEFISRLMDISHYANGTYRVSSSPNSLMKNQTFTFYLVPSRPITLGGLDEWTGSVFEVKRGFQIYKVQDNGLFLTVIDGLKKGQEIKYNISISNDEVISRHEGLIQPRVQLLKIDVNLAKGKYVFFEGEGNVFDEETYPKKKQGCWYIEIVDN